jgi:hypothetical protein
LLLKWLAEFVLSAQDRRFIAVKTKPVTSSWATPIGDRDSRATIDRVIAALKVTKA